MADVPNINPLRPLWPIRPEDRGQKRRNPDEEDRKGGQIKEKQEDHPDEGNQEDGHIDEYV